MMSLISNNKPPSQLQGVALALVSTGLFGFVGVLVRMLSVQIDLFQILLFRQVIFILLLTPAILTSLDVLLKPRKRGLHLLRIAGAFFALYFGFVTVSNLPLADATALGFTQVLFVALVSKLFLSESVNLSRFITLIIGFVGVILVVQPSFESASLLYTLLGLAAAFGAAVAVVCVRQMSKTESRTVLLTYQAVFVGLIAFIPSLFVWQWPTVTQWLLLILVGVISSIAQWIGVTAYKLAEANVVANVEYAKIIYSLLFGYFLFSELPNTLALMGVLITITSAALPLLINLYKKRTDLF